MFALTIIDMHRIDGIAKAAQLLTLEAPDLDERIGKPAGYQRCVACQPQAIQSRKEKNEKNGDLART